MPRKTSASTMPISSASCWYCRGTPNRLMMMMKMNRLSTDREYSVSQPAKNSVPYWCPAMTQTPMPKSTASADVDRQRDRDLPARGLVRAAADDDHVEDQDGDRDADGGPPDPGRDVHEVPPEHRGHGASRARDGLRRSLPPWRSARPAAPGPKAPVMTTPLRRNTPLQDPQSPRDDVEAQIGTSGGHFALGRAGDLDRADAQSSHPSGRCFFGSLETTSA